MSRPDTPHRSGLSLEKRSASANFEESHRSHSSRSKPRDTQILAHSSSTSTLSLETSTSDSGSTRSGSRDKRSQSRRASRSTQKDKSPPRSGSSRSLSHKSSAESLGAVPEASPAKPDTPTLPKAPADPNIAFSEDDPQELQSATLEGLEKHMQQQMSSPEQSSESKQFIEQIIITHRYFTTTPKLLESIIKIFFQDSSSVDSAIRQTRVFWALRTFIQFDRETLLNDPECQAIFKQFLDKLRAGDSQRQGYATFLERAIKGASEEIVAPPGPIPASKLPASRTQLTDELPPLDILSQQMTLAEFRYFNAIKLTDFFGSSWLKQSSAVNAVAASIEHSNSVSRWMASKILAQPTKQGRAKVVGKFIKLIDNLRDLHNLSSMMTVYMSLQLHCIARLKKTWKHVPKALRQQFQRHETLLRPMSNFAGYRELVGKASLPCIPYIGITAKDIVALDELPTQTEEVPDHINWYKMTQISRVLMDQVLRFKKSEYSYPDAPEIFAEMLNPEIVGLYDEDRLIEHSILVEPDEAPDKDRAPRETAATETRREREGSITSISPGQMASTERSSSVSSRSSPRLEGEPLVSDPFTSALIQALYSLYHRTLTSTGSLQAEDHSGEVVTLAVDMLQLVSQIGSINLRDEPTKTVAISSLLKHVCAIATEMSGKRFRVESAIDYRSNALVAPRVFALVTLVFTFFASVELGAGGRLFYATSQDADQNTLKVRVIVSQGSLIAGDSSTSASTANRLMSMPLADAVVPFLSRLTPFTAAMKAISATLSRIQGAPAFALTLVLPRSLGAAADSSRVLSRLHAKDVKTWTVDDVCDWVVASSTIDSKWSSQFSQNDISGSELTTLSEGDIVDMGIPKIHARAIIKEINALASRVPRSNSLPASSSFVAPNAFAALPDSRAESEASDSSSDAPAVSEWPFTVKFGSSTCKLTVTALPSETKPSLDAILVAMKTQLSGSFGSELTLTGSVRNRNFTLTYMDSEGDSMDVDSPAAFAKSCDYILEDSPEGGHFVLKLKSPVKASAVPEPPAFDMTVFLEKYKDGAEAVVLTKGDTASIQFINSQATRQFGLTMNTLLDVPIEAILVQPFEFYRELFNNQQLPTNTVLLGSAGPINVRLTLERSEDDFWIWILTPQHESSSSQAISIHEYRDKMAASPEPSVLISLPDYHIEAFNSAATELFQYDFAELFHKPLTILMPQFQREVTELVKQAEDVHGIEATSGSLLCQRRDGSLFVAAITVRQQADADHSYYFVARFVVA